MASFSFGGPGGGGRGGSSPTDTRLYETLGLSRNASDSEIKRAYHRLAKEFHPDKNPSAGDRFKEISYAYDVLSDPKKKEVYDRFGLKGLQEGGGDPMDPFGFGGGGGDIFSDIFGGGMFFGGGGGRRGPQRGENTVKPLKATLEDLYNGKSHTVKHKRKALCTSCSGMGTTNAKASKTCNECSGTGVKQQYRQLGPGLVQQIHNVCSKCSGNGTVISEKDKCVSCKGERIIVEESDIEVHIDKGMAHGTKITLTGKGDEEPGTVPGDLIFVVQQEPHEQFERHANDLILKHTLNLTESLCGFQLVIKHLDGRELLITNPKGKIVPSDSIQMIEDEGMPIQKRPFEKGSLLIKFKVEFPQNHFTDETQLKILETLLPPRPFFEKPTGDNVEEVDLYDFELNENNTTNESSDEDEPRGARVGCAQQ